MIIKDISFDTPEQNILYDEVLLSLAEQESGTNILRFWESALMFIVLGRISSVEDDLIRSAVIRDGIPVLRRCSGGGTVLQGPGCLNYSLILNKEDYPVIADLKKSYSFILQRIVDAFGTFNVQTQWFPHSDIAFVSNHKKFSGNAQKRGRKHILHHGTMLYDFNLSSIDEYLAIPKLKPEYRRDRPHLDFLDNLPVAADKIKQIIAQAFHAEETLNKTTSAEDKLLEEWLASRKIRIPLI